LKLDIIIEPGCLVS